MSSGMDMLVTSGVEADFTVFWSKTGQKIAVKLLMQISYSIVGDWE